MSDEPELDAEEVPEDASLAGLAGDVDSDGEDAWRPPGSPTPRYTFVCFLASFSCRGQDPTDPDRHLPWQ